MNNYEFYEEVDSCILFSLSSEAYAKKAESNLNV